MFLASARWMQVCLHPEIARGVLAEKVRGECRTRRGQRKKAESAWLRRSGCVGVQHPRTYEAARPTACIPWGQAEALSLREAKRTGDAWTYLGSRQRLDYRLHGRCPGIGCSVGREDELAATAPADRNGDPDGNGSAVAGENGLGHLRRSPEFRPDNAQVDGSDSGEPSVLKRMSARSRLRSNSPTSTKSRTMRACSAGKLIP